MSWIQKLFETYERCANTIQPVGETLWPVSHIVKQAHVEVVLDDKGNLLPGRIRKLAWNEAETLIPVTEASAGRTSGTDPHPLCEELSYCAVDCAEGPPNKKHAAYLGLLTEWCNSEYSHPKAIAVLAYINSGNLRRDLTEAGIFPLVIVNRRGQKMKIDDDKVFVRWSIEDVGNPCAGTWQDQALIEKWISFERSRSPDSGFCMATGGRHRLAKNHARFIRFSSDGAKLISSNDFDGLTFRGKFTDGKNDYGKQACTVGYEVSQKAHSALRWLIGRQAYRHDEQAVVSWAVSGNKLPDLLVDSLQMLGIDTTDLAADSHTVDTAQGFAIRLKNAIAGYGARLEPTEDIVVIGLDSATPGRMAITYYRELKGSEFLERVETWHSRFAWLQNFGKERRFVGAPSPADIAEAAYGTRVDDKLRKATVERLLPCIVDGSPIPLDLVRSVAQRATNRVGMEFWEWEKCLGIACALFKGYHIERSYQMSLETGRKSRDYLYGRLLAIADSIERYALNLADEGKKRETTAGRFMQRFADRPFSTWRNIELALKPYEARLLAGSDKSVAILMKRRKLLDEVMSELDSIDERTDDAPLSGEFLLGYHTQRQALWGGGANVTDEGAETEDSVDQTTTVVAN